MDLLFLLININLQKNGSAEFTADKAGTYEYHCSVMCGSGHTNMTGKLVSRIENQNTSVDYNEIWTSPISKYHFEIGLPFFI